MVKHVTGFDHPPYLHPYASAVISPPSPSSTPLDVTPSHWAKSDVPWMCEVHRDVIRARHKVISHNDEKLRKMWMVPPSATPNDVIPISRIEIAL